MEQKEVLKDNMKLRLIPKLTAVILTLTLCIGCAGSVGYAEGEDKGQSFESLDSPTDFISTDEKKEALEKSGDLPASFDLRSVDTDGDEIGDRCYVKTGFGDGSRKVYREGNFRPKCQKRASGTEVSKLR